MAHGAGSGDKLARGAVKASYLTTEKAITQKKWASMFEGFDPEEFKKNGMPKDSGVKEAVRSRR
jgi:hypothetical protein